MQFKPVMIEYYSFLPQYHAKNVKRWKCLFLIRNSYIKLLLLFLLCGTRLCQHTFYSCSNLKLTSLRVCCCVNLEWTTVQVIWYVNSNSIKYYFFLQFCIAYGLTFYNIFVYLTYWTLSLIRRYMDCQRASVLVVLENFIISN